MTIYDLILELQGAINRGEISGHELVSVEAGCHSPERLLIIADDSKIKLKFRNEVTVNG